MRVSAEVRPDQIKLGQEVMTPIGARTPRRMTVAVGAAADATLEGLVRHAGIAVALVERSGRVWGRGLVVSLRLGGHAGPADSAVIGRGSTAARRILTV